MASHKSIADEFADYTWQPIAKWMKWDGWSGWVGCERCWEDGDEAPCWGQMSCHGFYNGCGCKLCVEDDKRVHRPNKRGVKGHKSGK